MDQYRLTIGSSPGASDYFDDAAANTTATSETVTDIPCDGRPVYAQLYTKMDGYWLPPQSYTYSTPALCATKVTPPNGSVVQPVQTFTWTAAPDASGYQLIVTYI